MWRAVLVCMCARVCVDFRTAVPLYEGGIVCSSGVQASYDVPFPVSRVRRPRVMDGCGGPTACSFDGWVVESAPFRRTDYIVTRIIRRRGAWASDSVH